MKKGLILLCLEVLRAAVMGVVCFVYLQGCLVVMDILTSFIYGKYRDQLSAPLCGDGWNKSQLGPKAMSCAKLMSNRAKWTQVFQ